MVSGITGLTSSLPLFAIESVHPTWKSRQGHLFICMKLIVTGVTKSIEVLKKRGYCSNKLGYLYCNKSDYCRLILQMFFSVVNHINK